MTEVFRRVYRIFAHAWFQHRDVFWKVEGKTGLYVFFKTVCDEYRLIPDDNYTIPAEAEGMETTPVADSTPERQAKLLRRDQTSSATASDKPSQPAGNATLATGNTTKRHRGGMGDRPTSVSTVIHEEIEEEEGEHEQEGEEESDEHGVVNEAGAQTEPELARQPTIKAESQEPTTRTAGPDASAERAESEDISLVEDDVVETNASQASNTAAQDNSEAHAPPVEEEPVVEPMDPAHSAAGEGQDASQTVAD